MAHVIRNTPLVGHPLRLMLLLTMINLHTKTEVLSLTRSKDRAGPRNLKTCRVVSSRLLGMINRCTKFDISGLIRFKDGKCDQKFTK